MKTSTQIALVTALVGTLGLSALVRTVYALPTQTQVAVMPDRTSAKSVPEASDGDGETNDDAKEKQESSRLQSLAKITPEQARSAAEAAKGGTANSVELENENGSVVYSVIIDRQEVKLKQIRFL